MTIAVTETPLRKAVVRPRDAAAVLLLTREGGTLRVLMGKRSSAHVFMPNVHVFPGGRRDRDDHRIAVSTELHPAVLDRMRLVCGARTTDPHLRALAVAALRELHEEAHISIGRPNDSPDRTLAFLPDLAKLRYVARAVTPTSFPRRFDTHFFALFADEADVDPAAPKDSAELQDLRWIDVNDASCVTIPDITRFILADLANRLHRDPTLPFGAPVPYFYTRRGRFISDKII